MPGWCSIRRLTCQRRSDAGIVVNVTKRDVWMRFWRRGHARRCGSRDNRVLAATDENHFHPDTIPCEITAAGILRGARECLKEVTDATVLAQGIPQVFPLLMRPPGDSTQGGSALPLRPVRAKPYAECFVTSKVAIIVSKVKSCSTCSTKGDHT